MTSRRFRLIRHHDVSGVSGTGPRDSGSYGGARRPAGRRTGCPMSRTGSGAADPV
ncbi:hypothetical protein AB0F43_30025 [Kribbella sp. NPDC023972]|uniref:hypothetical protein n=1 Tax=Kribbella sp. NPDC023972 TaxID=3154795 RepID=UPI0033F9DF14